MQLPWVSRAAYDQAQARAAAAEEWLAAWERASHADRDRWLGLYRDLADKYHALKLAGAVAPPPPEPPVRQPLSTDLADEEAAMEEAAKPVPDEEEDERWL